MGLREHPRTLSAIEPARSGSKLRRLFLDGEPWRSTSSDALKLLELEPGQTVDERELADLLDQAELEACPARALRILESRDRSAGELRARLTQDGYAPDLVEDVIARLVRVGVVDDRRLADAILRGLADGKGYGTRRIRQELRRRAIPEPLAEEAVQAFVPENPEDERARLTARRLAGRVTDPQRLVERLVRKGFDWETARHAALDALEALGSDDA